MRAMRGSWLRPALRLRKLVVSVGSSQWFVPVMFVLAVTTEISMRARSQYAYDAPRVAGRIASCA